jgi:hypothetical protein
MQSSLFAVFEAIVVVLVVVGPRRHWGMRLGPHFLLHGRYNIGNQGSRTQVLYILLIH